MLPTGLSLQMAHRRQIGDSRKDPTQVSRDGEHAISYFSKRLSPPEEAYTANDLELLGLVYLIMVPVLS